jgi:hypothetical protein
MLWGQRLNNGSPKPIASDLRKPETRESFRGEIVKPDQAWADNPRLPLNLGQANPYAATTAKHPIGTRKAVDMSRTSPTQPINFGKSAPPIIAITMKEEANFDLSPKP